MKHKLPIIALALTALSLTWIASDGQMPGLRSTTRHAGKAFANTPDSPKNTALPKNTAHLDGNELVATAAKTIARLPNVSGQIRQRTQLFGRELAGTGRYRQWFDGETLRYRLDLRTRIGKQSAHFMQLGDGRFIWIRRELPSRRQLQRVDGQTVQVAMQRAGSPLGAWPIPSFGSLTLRDGLADVLRRFETQFDFSSPATGTIGREQIPVLTVRGTWKPGVLRQHYADIADEVLAGRIKRLPPTMPTHVEIVLGQTAPLQYFPYRISLLRRDSTGTTRLMELEFFSLAQNTPIDPSDFRYNPGGQDMEDITDQIIDRFRIEQRQDE